MGGYRGDIAHPYRPIMHENMRIHGKWMYERSDCAEMSKLIERGMLKLGKTGGAEITGVYPLEQWKDAWEMAAEKAFVGQYSLIRP